jgi:hypothetical protein
MALKPNNTIKDLDEALSILATDLPEADIAFFKDYEEEFVLAAAHCALGKWLRNNWGLWEPPLTESAIEQYKAMGLKDPLDWAGSTLVTYFHTIGIKHADDMSGIIIRSFHRLMRDRPMELEVQVQQALAFHEP